MPNTLLIAGAAVTAAFAHAVTNGVTSKRYLRGCTASGDLIPSKNFNELLFVGSPLVWTQFYPPRDK